MASRAYQVTIGERTLRVSLTDDGARLYARVDDGEPMAVQLDMVRGALHVLSVAERRRELLSAGAGEQVALCLDGLHYEAEVLDELRARLASVASAGAGAHARRELKAPMPGLVVRVNCAAGDQIEPGQALVVLQAMKMENELSLPRGGRVTSVSAVAGQTVEQGAVLVVVE